MDVYPFSASKFVNTALHNNYHPFGNTPAEDLLEHVPDSCKNPSVLQLGCGDIRSCFYTLWKNFDKSHRGNFEGVTFHLNDYCAAVLARNVLFLYWTLMLADIPEKDTHKTKRMVCSIWNIWFCHDLQHHDVVFLKESLTKLLEVFKSDAEWAAPTNPLRDLIDFVGEFKADTIQVINKMFTSWLKMLKETSSDEMKIILKLYRARELEIGNVSPRSHFIEYLFDDSFGIYSYMNDNLRHLMIEEYSTYIETGNAFAEKAFGMPVALGANSVHINPTLYDIAYPYRLEASSAPFKCFVHGHLMTKKNISFPPGTLLVQQELFENFPLLANSVQQFSMWLISASNYLSKCDVYLTKFILYCSDAISTSVRLRRTNNHFFDIIHSSNLIDHLTSFAVIMHTITLLSETGLLLTTLMDLKGHNSVINNIQTTFHFKLEHLLPLFGIRCIGQEGIYAGDGILQPIPSFRPPFEARIRMTRKQCLPRVLIWKSVGSTPLFLSSLNDQSLTTKALFNCIKGSTVGFLSLKRPSEYSSGPAVSTRSHSAMTALSIFKNRLSSKSLKSVKGYEFWDGLCSLLRNDPDMQLFLMHLQCQAILMNIHMHLITTPTDCPICNNTIAESFFKVSVPFNATFDMDEFSNSTSLIVICIHPNIFDTNSFNISNPSAAERNGVYLLDSNVCSVSSIDIVIPRKMIDLDKYSVTVYAYNFIRMEEKYIGIPLSTDCLKNINIVPYTPHPATIINPDDSLPLNPSSSFGELALMEYTAGGRYLTNISLSDKVISDLQNGYKLCSEMIADTSLKIICNTSEFIVEYSTPIDYNNLKIKYSAKRKLAMIEADCKPFDTYSKDQIQLFFVNPENRFILPQTNVSEIHLQQSGGSQLTIEDRNFIDKYGRDRSILPPSINAKEVFVSLFKGIHHLTFRLISVTEGDRITYGKIVVHNRLFDVQYQTPALDLSFYIKEEGIDMNDPAWSSMRVASNVSDKVIHVNRNEVSLVKQALIQFSNRTRTPKRAAIMVGMDKYFRRAIAYHLTSDACELSHESFPFDMCLKMLQKKMKKMNSKCSFCNSEVKTISKCTRCHNAIYCGEECQKKHWKVHKVSCKGIDRSSTKPAPQLQMTDHVSDCSSEMLQKTDLCFYCKSEVTSILKCSRCLNAIYCGEECQKKHWKVHKVSCKGIDRSSTKPAPQLQMTDHVSDCSSEMLQKTDLCFYCKSEVTSILKCSRCLNAIYCGEDCQKKHWKVHKVSCKDIDRSSTKHGPQLQMTDHVSDCSSEMLQKSDLCFYCNSEVTSILKCSRCHNAIYCGVECQKKHWKVHKVSCKNTDRSSATKPASQLQMTDQAIDCLSTMPAAQLQRMCSRCKSQSNDLKKCTRCRLVGYCCKQCQREDWSEHKLICKQT